MKQFEIPSIAESLLAEYVSGSITAEEVAAALFEANYYNFIPDVATALRRIGATA